MSNDLRDVIRQIRDACDIVEVVGRTVALKRAGNSWKGLCPFHNEKSPSFNVVPSKGIFHCFGCGKGGSAIDFVMATERLEFMEAVEKLALEQGISLPKKAYREGAERDADDQQKQRAGIASANDAARDFFRKNLLLGKNRAANAYLPERGVSLEMAEAFELGAALEPWDALRVHLTGIGFSEIMLVEAGLCVRSENGRIYDRFRNRLIFPIKDANGKVIGFGGRQLVKEENSPKYLNSAETALYKKSQSLYALNIARPSIENSGYAILCEGYMDVLMAHAHGHTQAIASLGTALTKQQSKLLKRYTGKTFFLYDGDSAGQKAMLRGGEALLEAGFDVRVLSLPPADDPDTFLRREGAEALAKLLPGAREFIDFALAGLSAGLELHTLAGQAELVERIAPVMNALGNEVMFGGAIRRLQDLIGGLPREAIQRILEQKKKDVARMEGGGTLLPPPIGAATLGPAENPAPQAQGTSDALDRGVLKLMLESHEALEVFRARLRHDWIFDAQLEGWIFFLLDHDGFSATLLDEIEAAGEWPAPRSVLTSIVAWDMPIGINAQATADEMLRRLQERYHLKLIAQLRHLLGEKSLTNPAESLRLLAVLQQENRGRFNEAGKHLRARDAASRLAKGRIARPTPRRPN